MPTVKRRKNKKSRKFIRRIIIFISIFILIFLLIDLQLRPIVTSMSANYVKRYAITEISKAVNDAIDSKASEYNDFVDIQTDSSGKVMSITTKARQITSIQNSILQSTNQKLSEFQTAEISVPMGSLSGIMFLSGLGPRAKIKMIPTGVVESQIVSSLEEAGINQTKHTIKVIVNACVTAVIPGFSSTVSTSCDNLIAESIIVGSVPNYYTKVISSSSSDPTTDISKYGNPKFSSEQQSPQQ